MLPFFESVEASGISLFIRESTWISNFVEVAHLLGLVVLLGAIFMMSLRLFGVVLTDRPLSVVAGEFARWTFLGITTMLVTGVVKAISEPMKLYYNDPYWWKMYFLLAALLFHFTMYRKVTRSDESHPFVRGLTGALALILWFGVGICGRAIGFF